MKVWKVHNGQQVVGARENLPHGLLQHILGLLNVVDHLLMENASHRSTRRGYDPHPVAGAAATLLNLVFKEAHETLGSRVVIYHTHAILSKRKHDGTVHLQLYIITPRWL